MMDKYNEIFEIFESQKQEITKLSNKVTELEETNAFLITILERTQSLPPIYDPCSLRKDKAAAIEREYTLKSFRDKCSNVDSTHCETTLNDSCDSNPMTTNRAHSCRWSIESSANNPLSSQSDTAAKPFENVNLSDDFSATCDAKLTGVTLRRSRTPPMRRPSAIRSVLGRGAAQIQSHSLTKDYSSDNKTTSNSDDDSDQDQDQDRDRDFLDSVIARSVNEIISGPEEKSKVSNKNGKFHVFPKMSDSQPTISVTELSSIANTMVSAPTENNNLKKALDTLLETLENNPQSMNTTESLQHSDQTSKSQLPYSESVHQLLTHKDQYISNINDKHVQMKLLLTTQQLQADLLHQSLEENSRYIFDNGRNMTQSNTSNVGPNSNKAISQHPTDDISEIPSAKLPCFSKDLQLFRQKELSRLNLKSNDQLIMENPKIQNGFIKFTALVKGYIVRTLCETDRVQNIIVTIKDTAKLAIKLRQERLSGDCPQSDDYNPFGYGNRRNNQEIISFQQRLVSQIKAALCELHEIFFDWPSSAQMRLIRHHINQLVSTGINSYLPTDEHDAGSSTVNHPRPRNTSKLSSATLKRRQKLALRPTSHKENGTKNASNSSTKPRKPIYKASYGCRGYVVGAHSAVGNPQTKITVDRKPRTNYVPRRRGGTRTVSKPNVDNVSTNTQSDWCATTNKSVKTIEAGPDKTIPNLTYKIPHLVDHQPHRQKQQSKQQSQQPILPKKHQPQPQLQPQPQPSQRQPQQRIHSKTITTSICSQPSVHNFTNKVNFVNIKSNGNHDLIHFDGDSANDSFNSNKFVHHQVSVSSDQVSSTLNNDSSEQDWRTRTYTLSNNNNRTIHEKNSSDFDKIYSSKCTISDNLSTKSNLSDFHENSISRVEVDINDIDIGYMCQNNSHYNGCYDDPTESPQNIVLVDIAQYKDTTLNPHKYHTDPPVSTVPFLHCPPNQSQSANCNLSQQRAPSKSRTVNRALSSPLTAAKSHFYVSVNSTDVPDNHHPTPFRIRKRIVACSSLYSSTVSHS